MHMTVSEVPRWKRRATDRSTGAVQLRSADRAQRVVAAVRRLTAERGSAEFTMVEVATVAGVPLRSLYRQFPNRDELLLALLEDQARLGASMLEETLSDADDPAERLRLFVRGLWDFMVRGSEYASVLVREHLRLAEAHPAETRACLEPLVDLMVQVMVEAGAGFRRPGSGRSHSDALVVFSVLLAHMQAVLLFHPEEDHDDAAEGVWDVFVSFVTLSDRTIAVDGRNHKEA